MFTLACENLGIVDCVYVAKGSTHQAAIHACIAHLTSVHPERMKSMKRTMTDDQMHSTLLKAVKDK